jgi:hypothetical protein
MKKLLVIVVLGLLLSGNVNADYSKYAKCYGEMTAAHKARGYHQSNRSMSIKVKETVCRAYADGEINDYEGKR